MKKTLNAILFILLLSAAILAFGIVTSRTALTGALAFPESGLEVTVWAPDSQKKAVLDAGQTDALTGLLAGVGMGGQEEAPKASSLTAEYKAFSVIVTGDGYGTHEFLFLGATGQGYLIRSARDVRLTGCGEICAFLETVELAETDE